ncbi:beta-1,4-glucuronyltransferase 1-like [Arctopsyche grandis]|uniref:beta-1,4-glucuronyltransferase 1-like n=1 Tax=Arctopsyche grandis TaxID=121162 RepID=UPI00406D95E4
MPNNTHRIIKAKTGKPVMLKPRNRLLRYPFIIYLTILIYIGLYVVVHTEFDFIFRSKNQTIAYPINLAEMDQIASATEDETVLDSATLKVLESILGCQDKSFEPSVKQRGEYWVLYNFVRAEHGPLGCYETVTYTTHSDFTFLDNLVPLLEKWRNPVSLAVHAPGADFERTVDSIRYLRDCMNTDLVRMYVTFHIYFSNAHIPSQIPNMDQLLSDRFDCSFPEPYTGKQNISYKMQNRLLYPVNIGRNIARESALTHFVLASDIELYPSTFLAERFLNMIARNKPLLNNNKRKIFTLNIFEVESYQSVPNTKSELLNMIFRGSAIPFHKKICAKCHRVPKSKKWLQTNETDELNVFHIVKRVGRFCQWEPIFIGTNSDPWYDERLSWEGKSDKMTQAYSLCVMDYDFAILNNAFLVHRPGIKIMTKADRYSARTRFSKKISIYIRQVIFQELKVLHGARRGCVL